MRVAVLSDYTFDERPGGATRMLRLLLGAAPSELEVRRVSPSDPPGAISGADVAFSYLVKLFPAESLEALCNHPRHVRWEIDWWLDIEPNADWRRRVNESARLVMFCSPLHQERFQRIYRLNLPNTICLPCPMDVGTLEAARRNGEGAGTVWCGEFHPFKGVDLAIRWARDNREYVDFYSPTMPRNPPQAEYCRFMGFVPEERWYETLAGYRRFIHFPRYPDAFPYSVLEAYALGLEVVTAGRLGVESYGVSWERLLEWCSTSAQRFWDVLQSAIA